MVPLICNFGHLQYEVRWALRQNEPRHAQGMTTYHALPTGGPRKSQCLYLRYRALKPSNPNKVLSQWGGVVISKDGYA